MKTDLGSAGTGRMRPEGALLLFSSCFSAGMWRRAPGLSGGVEFGAPGAGAPEVETLEEQGLRGARGSGCSFHQAPEAPGSAAGVTEPTVLVLPRPRGGG